MRYIICAALALALGACGGADTGLVTAVQVPELPSNLSKKATQLPPSTDLTMGGQVLDNTRNIREYNSVASQLNAVIDLYNCVREAINNKKEFECQ